MRQITALKAGTLTREILGNVERETDKAYQFTFEDDDGVERTEWFPKSQVAYIDVAMEEHEETVLTISQWIYDRKEEEWNQKSIR